MLAPQVSQLARVERELDSARARVKAEGYELSRLTKEAGELREAWVGAALRQVRAQTRAEAERAAAAGADAPTPAGGSGGGAGGGPGRWGGPQGAAAGGSMGGHPRGGYAPASTGPSSVTGSLALGFGLPPSESGESGSDRPPGSAHLAAGWDEGGPWGLAGPRPSLQGGTPPALGGGEPLPPVVEASGEGRSLASAEPSMAALGLPQRSAPQLPPVPASDADEGATGGSGRSGSGGESGGGSGGVGRGGADDGDAAAGADDAPSPLALEASVVDVSRAELSGADGGFDADADADALAEDDDADAWGEAGGAPPTPTGEGLG